MIVCTDHICSLVSTVGLVVTSISSNLCIVYRVCGTSICTYVCILYKHI